MGKILTAFILIGLATTASAGTTVREYDDRVVVEVTGTPQAPEEQERQVRINSLEYERHELAAELERLARSDDGNEATGARQRRDTLLEKSRRVQEIDKQLRELGYSPSQPQTLTDGSSSGPGGP